jgi:8-oxo-dGTP diphosphatase
MARVPIMAAGGIVLRRQQPPLVAVVRLRKRDEWVLPKGKLDSGETPREAAKREVWEETGHDVTMHEFLGTLVYESGGRSKVVHYWRMEACGGPTRELMNDVRAVDWLPLEAAVERLSRNYERAFLENVGPMALEAFARKPKAKPPAKKRRGRPAVTPVLPAAAPRPDSLPPPAMEPPQLVVPEESPLVLDDVAVIEQAVEPSGIALMGPSAVLDAVPDEDSTEESAAVDDNDEPEADGSDQPDVTQSRPRSLAQKVREWLGRAA